MNVVVAGTSLAELWSSLTPVPPSVIRHTTWVAETGSASGSTSGAQKLAELMYSAPASDGTGPSTRFLQAGSSAGPHW